MPRRMSNQQPVMARCGKCEHGWPVCWLPMQVRHVTRLIQAARCPRCGSRLVVLVGQADPGTTPARPASWPAMTSCPSANYSPPDELQTRDELDDGPPY